MPSSKVSLCLSSRSIRFGSRVPWPFASVTSPKRIDREGLGESRTWPNQEQAYSHWVPRKMAHLNYKFRCNFLLQLNHVQFLINKFLCYCGPCKDNSMPSQASRDWYVFIYDLPLVYMTPSRI